MSLVEIFHLNMLPKSGGVAVAEKVRSWNKAEVELAPEPAASQFYLTIIKPVRGQKGPLKIVRPSQMQSRPFWWS